LSGLVTDSAAGVGSLLPLAIGLALPGPSALVGWVFVVLGGLLLLVGVQNWRNRRDTSEPPVLASIAGMGPASVAFLTLGATSSPVTQPSHHGGHLLSAGPAAAGAGSVGSAGVSAS
jgi:uncharacterized protein involved in response to NO